MSVTSRWVQFEEWELAYIASVRSKPGAIHMTHGGQTMIAVAAMGVSCCCLATPL